MIRKWFRQREDLKTFRNVVKSLMDGIHKFDQYLEKVSHEKAYGYNTISFVERSLQDLVSLVDVYKSNRYFHLYNVFLMNQYLETLNEIFHELEPNARTLDLSIQGINYGRELYESIIKQREESELFENDDEIDEIKSKLESMDLEIKELIIKIHRDILSLRSIILLIREMVARDYIKILSNIDIPHTYQYDEKRVKGEISLEIRYLRNQNKKSNKEEIKHE